MFSFVCCQSPQRFCTPEVTRQDPRPGKRKKRIEAPETHHFIMELGERMLQQSEATTRLQEKMVDLIQPLGRDLADPIHVFHRSMNNICKGIHSSLWYEYTTAVSNKAVELL